MLIRTQIDQYLALSGKDYRLRPLEIHHFVSELVHIGSYHVIAGSNAAKKYSAASSGVWDKFRLHTNQEDSHTARLRLGLRMLFDNSLVNKYMVLFWHLDVHGICENRTSHMSQSHNQSRRDRDGSVCMISKLTPILVLDQGRLDCHICGSDSHLW